MMSISRIANCLRMREHQLLLAHGGGVLDLELFGKGDELGRSFGLEVLEFHFPHAGSPMGMTGGDGSKGNRWSARGGGERSQSLGAQASQASGPMQRQVPLRGPALGCICLRSGR